MNVTILGNSGPYSIKGGACSSYLIQSGQTSILNDCGPGSVANLRTIMDPIDLDAIVLSHFHYDHISDLLGLSYYFQSKNKKMLLYVPNNPRNILELFLENVAFEVYTISDCKLTHIKDMTVTFCEMTHPIKSYATKFRDDNSTFVYSGDTNYNSRLETFAENCDLLIVDGGNTPPHLSPEDCDNIEIEANPKKMLISHLNPEYDNEAIFSQPLANLLETYKID